MFSDIECPYCREDIDYATIMGDSDWDDQGYDDYRCECPHCDKSIIITQIDIEVVRMFRVIKNDEE